MILDANIKDHLNYELFDANGNKLDYVIRADTETGEIVVPSKNSEGKFYHDGYGDLVTETVFVPAPLKAIKHE